jgi:hypothetical protein
VSEIQLDELELPDVLAILPLKDTVVFPESMTPLAIGQERSVKLIDDVIAGDERLLALVTVRDPEVETPGFADLYEIGTAAVIHKMIKVPDGTLRIPSRGSGASGSPSRPATTLTWSGASRRCRTSSPTRRRRRRSRATSRTCSRA